MGYVYFLECVRDSEALIYIGSTNSLERRLSEHAQRRGYTGLFDHLYLLGYIEVPDNRRLFLENWLKRRRRYVYALVGRSNHSLKDRAIEKLRKMKERGTLSYFRVRILKSKRKVR